MAEEVGLNRAEHKKVLSNIKLMLYLFNFVYLFFVLHTLILYLGKALISVSVEGKCKMSVGCMTFSLSVSSGFRHYTDAKPSPRHKYINKIQIMN